MGKYLVIKGANYEAQSVETVQILQDYDVILGVLPEGSGTVLGSGAYPQRQQAQISAEETNPFYEFTKWSDDNTNAQRTITVSGDIILQALFNTKNLVNLTDFAPYATNQDGLVLGVETGLVVIYQNFKSGYIPIPSGYSTVEIPPSSYRDAVVALTKDNPLVSGSHLEYATGETPTKLNTLQEPLMKSIPSDAKYMYFTYKAGDGTTIVAPSYLKFSK